MSGEGDSEIAKYIDDCANDFIKKLVDDLSAGRIKSLSEEAFRDFVINALRCLLAYIHLLEEQMVE